MKHYFYFVRHLGNFEVNDVVYKVSVGSSQRDQVKFELVRLYASDCGMYFQPVSDRSDRAILKLSESLFTGTSFPEIYLHRANVSISDLYRMIIDDSFGSFEDNLTESPAKIRLISQLSPTFRLLNQTFKRNTLRYPYKSKHLSPTEGSLNTRVAISFCLILALFLLSGYLEGIERGTYLF